jgi:hypothetical protein
VKEGFEISSRINTAPCLKRKTTQVKKTVLALLGASLCHGSILLQTQADSCLDSNASCTSLSSGTLHNGNDFNTFAESAIASFGILHVTASSTFNVNNGWALALGYVAFTDDLTITSPSHANGTLGKLTLGYYIDGTTSATGGGHAFLQVIARDYDLNNPSSPLVNYVKDYPNSTNGSFVVPVTMPFVYGTKFELYLSMQATAGSIIDSGVGYSNPNVTAAGSGTVNFFNTLVLNQLQTSDNGGIPVGDSVIIGDSGTAYTQAGVAATPEPCTWALTALAIPVLVWRRRRAR